MSYCKNVKEVLTINFKILRENTLLCTLLRENLKLRPFSIKSFLTVLNKPKHTPKKGKLIVL